MCVCVCVSVSVALGCAVQRKQGYASLQDEAVRVFNSLQEMETLGDTVPIIQGILQTCQDLRPLTDEVTQFFNTVCPTNLKDPVDFFTYVIFCQTIQNEPSSSLSTNAYSVRVTVSGI